MSEPCSAEYAAMACDICSDEPCGLGEEVSIWIGFGTVQCIGVQYGEDGNYQHYLTYDGDDVAPCSAMVAPGFIDGSAGGWCTTVSEG